MRLRKANKRRKIAYRRKFSHRVEALIRAWKRFEWNSEGLKLGAYCFGCRGHPGIVTQVDWDLSNPWGSDFSVTSLIDGIEENCSVYHCGFAPTSKEVAEAYAAYSIRHGDKMATIKFFPHAYKNWEDQWNDPDHTNPYKSGCSSLQEYLGLNDEEFQAHMTGVCPD